MKINDFNEIKADYQKSQKLIVDKCDEIAILIRENWIKSVILTSPTIQEEFNQFEVDDVRFNEKMDCFSISLSGKDDVDIKINDKTYKFSSKIIYVDLNMDDIDENGLYHKAIQRAFEKDLNRNIQYINDNIAESLTEIDELNEEIKELKNGIKKYNDELARYNKIKKSYNKNKRRNFMKIGRK